MSGFCICDVLGTADGSSLWQGGDGEVMLGARGSVGKQEMMESVLYFWLNVAVSTSHTLRFVISVWLIEMRTPRYFTEDRSQTQMLERFTMTVHHLCYAMFTVFVLDCFEYPFCHTVNISFCTQNKQPFSINAERRWHLKVESLIR